MAQLSFDIADLFERTFGYKTQAFSPNFSDERNNRLRAEQGVYGSPFYGVDSLGTEYYMPVTILYPGGQKDSAAEGGEGQLKKWDLPFPVVSIKSRKTIIDTPLTERRGTVKELVNIQNYDIVVKGFIIGEGDEFPEEEVGILRTIYEQNTALSMQCPLTDIFLVRPDRSGSDQVVIRELKFPSIKGVKNVRPYELHFESDEPFNLKSIK